MQIHRLPAFRDNYLFVLHDRDCNIAAVVDPGDAAPVLRCLESLGATLVAIFNTHHHSDHVGGNTQLLQRFPEAIVYGGAEDRGRIPGQQVFLHEGDRVSLGDRTAEVFFVPGHTRGTYCLLLSASVGDRNGRSVLRRHAIFWRLWSAKRRDSGSNGEFLEQNSGFAG